VFILYRPSGTRTGVGNRTARRAAESVDFDAGNAHAHVVGRAVTCLLRSVKTRQLKAATPFKDRLNVVR
jgi:hypothetical protein